MLSSFEVQGHRGCRGLRPENSLPSFIAAIEGGSDVLELDLLVTQDGELIIHHNFCVNPELCTYLSGHPILNTPLIYSLPLSEIKQLDCGAKTNPLFPKQKLLPGTQIPTLGELFAAIHTSSHPNAKKIRLNLELKRDPTHPEWTPSAAEFAKKIVEKVEKSGLSARVYYSSFDPEILAEVRKLDPKARIGLLFEPETFTEILRVDLDTGLEFILKIAQDLKAQILSPDHNLLKDADHVRSLKQMGFRIIPWTVNTKERWEELIQWGVDGIITDYPHELVQFLKTKHLHDHQN